MAVIYANVLAGWGIRKCKRASQWRPMATSRPTDLGKLLRFGGDDPSPQIRVEVATLNAQDRFSVPSQAAWLCQHDVHVNLATCHLLSFLY